MVNADLLGEKFVLSIISCNHMTRNTNIQTTTRTDRRHSAFEITSRKHQINQVNNNRKSEIR